MHFWIRRWRSPNTAQGQHRLAERYWPEWSSSLWKLSVTASRNCLAAIFCKKISLGSIWMGYVWFSFQGSWEGDTIGQNDKGLCTRERIPKDAYFFYRSVWSSEKTIYITERRHNVRPCNVPFIKIYSNAQSIELIVNDKSLGIIKRSELPNSNDTVFVWNNVNINKNEKNTVTAKATFDDDTIKYDKVCWYGE